MKNDVVMPQGMTYSEREALKYFATRCGVVGDNQSLERTLIMIAHWMRQGRRVTFTEYASQWTEAQKHRKDGNQSTPEMAEAWPFRGKRCISPGGSDYFAQGVQGERVDDETEIRHAVTVLLADYPEFNSDGLALHNRGSAWMHPAEKPAFMTAAISCLDWIRRFGLLNSQVKYFNTDNPTSYGLKHHIEDFNRQNHGQTVSHPAYIMNGAVIAAMVAGGYRVKQATRMNAWFNISRKALTSAMNKK